MQQERLARLCAEAFEQLADLFQSVEGFPDALGTRCTGMVQSEQAELFQVSLLQTLASSAVDQQVARGGRDIAAGLAGQQQRVPRRENAQERVLSHIRRVVDAAEFLAQPAEYPGVVFAVDVMHQLVGVGHGEGVLGEWD